MSKKTDLLQAHVDSEIARRFRYFLLDTKQSYANWLRSELVKTLTKHERKKK